MSTLLEVNVLLAVCYENHIHHTLALSWLDEQKTSDVILCRIVQMSLLRLLTNQTVMGEDVCSMAQAWEIYDIVLEDDRFEFFTEPDDIVTQFRAFSKTALPSPKLWQDAYLAAFAVSTNMELVTFDQGFQQFSGLKLILLRN